MEIKKNKKKIFNDPVHGFITIPNDQIFDLIEHEYFQRLRRISQTALASMVYPGATHNRFLHALGCVHLMGKSIQVLKQKNISISIEEEKAVYAAILLHDVGHGPFSHTLERTLAEGIHHENISFRIIQKINKEMNGELDLCLEMFQGKYHRPFFKQLISSQIDVDRLDYLMRDSFYTGVVEGMVNSDRIISMFNVKNDCLVLDAKGIYSIEKFFASRVFMYWQVYLHKTSSAVEIYLSQAIKRAREILKKGGEINCSAALKYFLKRAPQEISDAEMDLFLTLDDTDIWTALKEWQKSDDYILSTLSDMIIKRKLPTCFIQNKKLTNKEMVFLKNKTSKTTKAKNTAYFVHQNKLEVIPYDKKDFPIMLLYKDGSTKELQKTEEQVMSKNLNKKQVKYHVCYIDEGE